jgi:nucleoside 2-deoxyribosyltransferase
MNIYFACSITGGRELQPVYQAIVEALLADGHVIPTQELAQPHVPSERALDPRVVYERDTGWIDACDLLIAEVSVPSHGVGYEVGYALGKGKPVLCLYQEGRPLSKMISGNPDSGLKVDSYCDLPDALAIIRTFLAQSTCE